MKKSASEGNKPSRTNRQSAPFGAQNRERLIAAYVEKEGALSVESAWKIVYGLLLWTDKSIGLAHCYESDKCQPGRTWYGRTLAFHKWLSNEFEVSPADIGAKIDWLFQAALQEYLVAIEERLTTEKEKGAQQRAAFGQNYPLPGADPEIERLIGNALKPFFSAQPPPETFDLIAGQLREYWRQENKRKNLLGEGFEDVLAVVISAAVGVKIAARTRTSVADIQGFYAPGAKDKATKVDLVIERRGWMRPALVNVKWSFRADREDQLWDDFREYVRFDRDHRGFDHYLVTNEFDPARLNAVCDRREANNFVFKNVVHINTDAVLATYSLSEIAEGKENSDARELSSMAQVCQQIRQGRLVSLSKWLKILGSDG